MRLRAALLPLLLASSSAAAQAPWKSSYFPYVLGNPADGAMLVLRWQRTQNAPYFLSRSDTADVVNPITLAGTASVEAGIGTLGSRFGRVEFRGPGLVHGWRVRGLASAERRARFGYYGLGGDVDQAGSAIDPNGDGYRVRRNRYYFHGEATRTISTARGNGAATITPTSNCISSRGGRSSGSASTSASSKGSSAYGSGT